MKNYIIIVIALVSVWSFSSCDKDDDDDQICESSNQSKSAQLDLDFTVGDDVFAYDTVYELNDVAIEFSDLRFYLSDFELQDDDGNADMLDAVILVDAGASDADVTLGSTDFDHVHELHLLLGLNEIVNHADPEVAEAPLNDASMHWSWNPESGYKFIKIEIMVDTDDDGTPDTPSSIHCATDLIARQIVKSTHTDVEDSIVFQIEIDIATIFQGVDFLNLEGTHGYSDLTSGIADRMALELGAD